MKEAHRSRLAVLASSIHLTGFSGRAQNAGTIKG